jgi:hypothetical protein
VPPSPPENARGEQVTISKESKNKILKEKQIPKQELRQGREKQEH